MSALQHCGSLLVTGLFHTSCRHASHIEINGLREDLPDRVIKIYLTLNQDEEPPEISLGDTISLDYCGLCVRAIYKDDRILYGSVVQSEKPN